MFGALYLTHLSHKPDISFNFINTLCNCFTRKQVQNSLNYQLLRSILLQEHCNTNTFVSIKENMYPKTSDSFRTTMFNTRDQVLMQMPIDESPVYSGSDKDIIAIMGGSPRGHSGRPVTVFSDNYRNVHDRHSYRAARGRGQHQPDQPSIPMLFLLSMPRLPIQMAWAAQWAAMGPYLGTMLAPWSLQLIQLIGPLTGLIIAPVIGVLSDRSTHSWGRRRPFLFYASIMTGLCWSLMAYTTELGILLGDKETNDGNRFWTTVLAVFFYTWMDVTVNIVQVPTFLLISDFAGKRQTTGAALGQAWASLGAIIISLYIWLIGPAHENLRAFLALLACTMIVVVAVVCFLADEVPLQGNYKDSEATCVRICQAFGSIYDGIVTLPKQLAIYALMMFLGLYGFTAYNGNKGAFFGILVLNGDPEGAGFCEHTCTEAQRAYNHGVHLAGGITDLLFNCVSYAYLLVLPFFVRNFGAKYTLILAMIPQSLLMVMAFYHDIIIDIIIAASICITSSTLFALLVPILVHIMGHHSDIGLYVGALNSANCMGQLLNFLIGAAIVNTKLGYALPVFVGGAMSFLAIFCALRMKLVMFSL